MKGSIKSTQTENGKETTSTIDISGQYVGPCANTTLSVNHHLAQGASERELSLKEKELDLKKQELELKQRELDLQSGTNGGNNNPRNKSTLDNVNNAVNTTNNVKNTFNGLRSLLGR